MLETTQNMVGAEHWPVELPQHQLQKRTDNVLGPTIKRGPNATHTGTGTSAVPMEKTASPLPHDTQVDPCAIYASRGRLGNTVSHSGRWVWCHSDGLNFPH